MTLFRTVKIVASFVVAIDKDRAYDRLGKVTERLGDIEFPFARVHFWPRHRLEVSSCNVYDIAEELRRMKRDLSKRELRHPHCCECELANGSGPRMGEFAWRRLRELWVQVLHEAKIDDGWKTSTE